MELVTSQGNSVLLFTVIHFHARTLLFGPLCHPQSYACSPLLSPGFGLRLCPDSGLWGYSGTFEQAILPRPLAPEESRSSLELYE